MILPIACAQIASAPFDPQSNLDKAEQYIREAARQGARLVLLPEFLTTNCAYDRRLHQFAEPLVSTPELAGVREQVAAWWAGPDPDTDDEDVDFTVDGRPFAMQAGETIHTENSHKYGPNGARQLLRSGGWTPIEQWTDANDWFALILCEAQPLRRAP